MAAIELIQAIIIHMFNTRLILINIELNIRYINWTSMLLNEASNIEFNYCICNNISSFYSICNANQKQLLSKSYSYTKEDCSIHHTNICRNFRLNYWAYKAKWYNCNLSCIAVMLLYSSSLILSYRRLSQFIYQAIIWII